jgi:membrane fusion protein (multidrug efflux system)
MPDAPSGSRVVAPRQAAPLLFLAAALAGCGAEPAKPPQPVPTVIVASVQPKDLSSERTFTGRIEAIEKVPLRARVQGFLIARNFEEGAKVEKGRLLYEIDKLPFELAVKQAEGNLANAAAALQLARLTFERQQELAERGSAASSKAQLDQARVGLAQAEAMTRVREAELKAAQVNLGYTGIHAPFEGRIGRSAYAVGDIVGPSGNPLATLVAQDPVYVTFPVPQRVLLDVRRSAAGRDDYLVQIRLADGSVYSENGQIRFADVQATASTDSISVRASIPNPKGDLTDQQLVEVMVVRKEPETRLVMPQSALLLDQQGAFALVVDKAGKVEQRRIRVGAQAGPLIVVESGLSAGDSVVVNGHRSARPGSTVKTQAEETSGTVRPGAAPPAKK